MEAGFCVDAGTSYFDPSAPSMSHEEEAAAPTVNDEEMKVIQCHVCKSQMDISNKKETFVVKCSVCNEATVSSLYLVELGRNSRTNLFECRSSLVSQPIRKAPPKKRYIRCSCQCLLICFENAQRIVCPRSNCKKIITVKDVPAGSATKTNPTATAAAPPFASQQRSVAAQNSYLSIGQYRSQQQQTNRDFGNVGSCFVICGHCGHRFMFNTLLNTLARCNSCRRLSSVGKEFSRTRGAIFLVLFLMFIAVGLGVQFGAAAYSDSYLVIALYAILYIISVIFFGKSVYYLSMKISHIDGQGNSAM
jgi:uncharacterized protein (DUF983 family)